MTITTYTAYRTLPSGYDYADAMQSEAFAETGSVPGAIRVCFVGDDLAVRLRPPVHWDHVVSPCARRQVENDERFTGNPCQWYEAQYNLGWAASRRVGRTGQPSEQWDSGQTSAAWDDGYLDHAAGRPKWHLTYCTDHDACGEGAPA